MYKIFTQIVKFLVIFITTRFFHIEKIIFLIILLNKNIKSTASQAVYNTQEYTEDINSINIYTKSLLRIGNFAKMRNLCVEEGWRK